MLEQAAGIEPAFLR